VSLKNCSGLALDS